ncbi:MAG: flagellar biosynthetic protein FliR [Deltaproteobacteria bacterium]|nr:flagellar biosynthetic protein FliR [Deltaproteobacteria bacterium]
MNLPSALTVLANQLQPHLWPVALCGARLLPVCLMCPVFGGGQAPSQVRLSLALMLALFVHVGCGIALPATFVANPETLIPAFATQLFAGLCMGYVAALPFDAARIGGRLLDTLRGANAEASLPEVGQKDAATAGMLHQLLCATLFACGGYRLVMGAVVKSFGALPLVGGAMNMTAAVELCAAGALAAMATGLAIGAPAAAVSLVVDVGLGLAARAAPQLKLADTGAPVKLGLGAAAILLSLGAVSERLLGVAAESVQTLGLLVR